MLFIVGYYIGAELTQYSLGCSEIGSLTSLDAPELHASSNVREPISLHQAVYVRIHSNVALSMQLQNSVPKIVKEEIDVGSLILQF